MSLTRVLHTKFILSLIFGEWIMCAHSLTRTSHWNNRVKEWDHVHSLSHWIHQRPRETDVELGSSEPEREFTWSEMNFFYFIIRKTKTPPENHGNTISFLVFGGVFVLSNKKVEIDLLSIAWKRLTHHSFEWMVPANVMFRLLGE